MIFKSKSFKINNKILNLFKKIKNVSAYILFFQVLILIIFFIWYTTTSAIVRHNPSKIFTFFNDKIKNVTGFEIEKLDDYIYVTSKGILYNILPSKLEKIDLSLSQESILGIEFQRKNRGKQNLSEDIIKQLSDYYDGSILYNEENYPIKLRVKGDRKIHFENFHTTSFKVDLRRYKRLWGLEEFSLQKPIVRNYIYEFIYHKLNHEVGNISLTYKAVDLSLNGINRGVFIIEEGFSNQLIERHGKRNGPIYTGIDELSGEYPEISYEAYSEMYWVSENIDLLRAGYSILNNIKENNNIYENYLSWEQWAKFFAITDLMQTYHGALPRNLKIFYNPVIGKIEPISFDGHYGTADFSNFIILDFLNQNSNCQWICDQREWFLRFLLNKSNMPRTKFIEMYINQLIKITDPVFIKEFLKKYDREINELNNAFYKDFSKSDQIFWKGWVPYVYEEDYLIERSKKIRAKLKNLNASNIFFKKKNNKLYIDPTTNRVPFKISSGLECNTKSEYWIIETTKINWENSCNHLKLTSIDGKEKNLYLYNNPKIDKEIVTVNFKNFKNIQDYFKGQIIGDKLYLNDKKLIIDKNLILPKDLTLNISQDQQIILANNSSLVLYGDLNISGVKDNPVIIKGSVNKPGSIISIGNKLDLKNVEFTNLKFPSFKGYKLYSGLNIIDAEVEMKNIKISKFIGEDMINLINSNTKIQNLFLENSKSDALDSDKGSINFVGITCKNIGNDCIDISNTKIEGINLFSEKVSDKTLSLGENSRANLKNVEIFSSEIGIAVKDASIANIENVLIAKTTLPIAVFVKKFEYGPASLNAKNLKLQNSNKIFLVDNLSELTIENRRILGQFSGKEIESKLYGNEYGKATLR